MNFARVILALGLGMTAGAASANNLILNGDFSAGFSGFTTQYTPVSPTPNALYPEGDITITDNPFSVHNLWVNLGPTGNPMLIVNGATSGAPTIWEEDGLATTAGGTYKFGATVMDICCNADFGGNPNAPSKIIFQVSVNDGAWTDIASYMTTPGAVAQSGDSGVPVSIAGAFTSTAGGHFDIRALNGLDAASGNDFAIDSLSVTGVPEPTTWALMLLGFGMAGAALRKGRVYRLVEYDADGRALSEEFRAEDDGAALSRALDVAEGVRLELWRGAKLIERRETHAAAAA
jgi:PEP-CTERM motif-containing protein